MAYKFQVGDARMSGSLTQEEGLTVVAGGATVTAGGVTITAGGLNLDAGGADFNNTNLTNCGAVSGVTTLGTSGAATMDSGGTGSTFGGALTATGILKTDDTTDATSTTNGSLQTDGGLSVAKKIYNGTDVVLAADSGTVTMGAATALVVSAAGAIAVNNATDSTAATNGSLQTDGGLGVVKDIIAGADVKLLADSSVLSLGVGSDATFTHDGTTGLTIAATPISINSTGDLTLDSSTDIVLDAAGGNFAFKDAGTLQLTIDVDTTAGDIDVNLAVDGDDLVFNQYDGTEVLRLTDGADVEVGDDLTLKSDSAVLGFGADTDTTLTHVADTGLLLNGARELQFRDSAIYISSSADGFLDLTADTKINMSGAVGMTSTLAVAGATTLNGAVTLGNATGDDIKIEGYVAGGIVPKTDALYNLGSAGRGWNDLHLGEAGIINWDSGDMTIAQASDVMTIAGGTLTATFTNAFSDAANSGLSGTTYNGSAAVSDWALDLNDLTAADINVANDSFAFIDSDGNVTRKESIADLATLMAGAGITATNGVFSTDAAATPSSTADGTTLSEGFNYFATDLTGSSGAVVHLPVSPDAGDVVYVKAKGGVSATSTITIKRTTGTHTIDGNSEIVIESPYGAVSLSYVVANDWRVF